MRQLLKYTQGSSILLSSQIRYGLSNFDKFLYVVRSFLNKMANEDKRTFQANSIQKPNPNLPAETSHIPQTVDEAENLFIEAQKNISVKQKNRMQLIDEVLNTNTHFYEVKKYEQRISVDDVMVVDSLMKKYREISRVQLDFASPQMGFFSKLQKTRKYVKWMKKLRKYPSGRTEVTDFKGENALVSNLNNDGKHKQLIQFLGEEALFTKLALSELHLTISSILSEKILQERDGMIIDLDENEMYFYWNQQVYFLSNTSQTIYRISQSHFDKILIHSIDALSSCLAQKTGNIELVISFEQIYECATKYYYDERVSEYLKRIQNFKQDIISHIKISPDGNSVFVFLDLLNNSQEFMGLYKIIGTTGINYENVLFNFLSEVVLRDDGELYYVQRNEEGLFIEFCKTKFTKIIKPVHPNTNGELQKHEEEETRLSHPQRQYRILYKCNPFETIKILENESNYINNNKMVMSQSIVVEVKDIGKEIGNRIMLITHCPGLPESTESFQQEKGRIQLINFNNKNLAQFFKAKGVKEQYPAVYEWTAQVDNYYTECFEIFGVGFLIVRYQLVDNSQGSKLKYCNSIVQTTFATLLPFKGYLQTLKQPLTAQQPVLSSPQPRLQISPSSQSPNLPNLPQSFSIQLPNQNQVYLQAQLQQNYQKSLSYNQLDYPQQHIIYICPTNSYINNIKVLHASPRNVYLIGNLSVYSVYNRNSLHIHPLRKQINPYTLMLDGYHISVTNFNNIAGKINLELIAPLLTVPLEYTVWKKELKEIINERIHVEYLTVCETEQTTIKIKVISNSKFASMNLSKSFEVQPIILYIPTSSNMRLSQDIIYKMLQKGVMFVEITQCRGMFGTTMVETVRGTQKFYQNYIQDIYTAILYLKKNVGDRVSVYAEGYQSCYAALMINILENTENKLFDATILHEGHYDTSQIPKQAEYFFGKGQNFPNPYKFQVYNPMKSSPIEISDAQIQQDQVQGEAISNLQNIVFSSLSKHNREQSRKFVHKLRAQRGIFYETVFLKEFDMTNEKDEFNLAYLFHIMKDKQMVDYKEAKKKQAQQTEQDNLAESRQNKDRIMSEKKSNPFI